MSVRDMGERDRENSRGCADRWDGACAYERLYVHFPAGFEP